VIIILKTLWISLQLLARNCAFFISTILLVVSSAGRFFQMNCSDVTSQSHDIAARRTNIRCSWEAHRKFVCIHPPRVQRRQVISRGLSFRDRRQKARGMKDRFSKEGVNLRISTRSISLFRDFVADRGRRRSVPASHCRSSVDFRSSIVESRVPSLWRARWEELVLLGWSRPAHCRSQSLPR